MHGARVPHRCDRAPWPHGGPRAARLSPACFSVLQDMCKIALMYCRLVKERAEALSLSEGEAANRVGPGAGAAAEGAAGLGPGFWAKRGTSC